MLERFTYLKCLSVIRAFELVRLEFQKLPVENIISNLNCTYIENYRVFLSDPSPIIGNACHYH